MTASTKNPVLIVGGSGVVGSRAAKTLRRIHPGLPITIGGRDLDKARTVAAEIGNADAVTVDLTRSDLGQPADERYSALAMFVNDEGTRSLRYAQRHGVPYIEISTAAVEIAPLVALHALAPAKAPLLLLSHVFAGTTTLATLHFARMFRRVDEITILAVLDDEDVGGPAADADFERWTIAAPSGHVVRDGAFTWLAPEDAKRTTRGVDGVEIEAQAFPVLDTVSLFAATGARSIRFDLAVSETASRRRGEPPSAEAIVELTGELASGARGTIRHEIVHPEGQVPMSALGVAVAVERLLGLAGGPPVPPGLYMPNGLIDPEHMMKRLTEIGTRIRLA